MLALRADGGRFQCQITRRSPAGGQGSECSFMALLELGPFILSLTAPVSRSLVRASGRPLSTVGKAGVAGRSSTLELMVPE